jgi:hypothetical protein
MNPRFLVVLCAAISVTAVPVHTALSFEVASVKPDKPGAAFVPLGFPLDEGDSHAATGRFDIDPATCLLPRLSRQSV